MGKTIHALEVEYGAIRAGRANPQILDKLTVDYYGTPTPINQLASVSATEARVLTIQPWDASTLKEIENYIATAEMQSVPLTYNSAHPDQDYNNHDLLNPAPTVHKYFLCEFVSNSSTRTQN